MAGNSGSFTLPSGGFRLHYSLDAALTSMPAYCASERTGSLLDPLREILNDGNYVMGIRAVPSTQQQNYSNLIPANSMFEDQISVPEGSFLTMIGGVITLPNGRLSGTAMQFRVRMFDVGSQSYLSDGFVHFGNTTGQIRSLTSAQIPAQMSGTYQGINRGLFILPSPYAVSSPGQVNVQIVSLNDVTTNIDMAFYFAIPVHNHTQVKPGAPSGNFNRKGA